jgi:hypothetical protein
MAFGSEDTDPEQGADQGALGGESLGLPAGMMQGGIPQPPPPKPGIGPGRHLLTGLVGVLIDGLQAGMQTPQSGQGFSQSAAMAAQLPQQRQQKNIALQSQQLQLKAQLAQSHVQDLQTKLLASKLDEEMASGLTNAGWEFYQQALKNGTAKMVSGETDDPGTATAKQKELHDSNPDSSLNMFVGPGMKKGTWAVWEVAPKGTLQEDMDFTIPGTKSIGGEIEDEKVHFDAGTDMGTVKVLTSNKFRDMAAKAHAESTEKIAENKPDQTQVVERQVGNKPHSILVNKRTGADIKDLGEAPPKGSLIGGFEAVKNQGRMLVEGDLDPTQVSKRTSGAVIDEADKYSREKYGKPYNAAQQQSDYKFATNVQTQNTLKYLNSLTGNDNKSGNLGALVSMSDKITRTEFPAINNAAAWSRLQSGDPAIAGYKAAVTEVADQVAKILQGGGSGAGTSDAKLKEAQSLLSSGFTKAQIKEVASTLRTLLANRKLEMIGDNVYLKKQYGRQAATAERDKAAGGGKFDWGSLPAKPQ